MHMYYIYSCSA